MARTQAPLEVRACSLFVRTSPCACPVRMRDGASRGGKDRTLSVSLCGSYQHFERYGARSRADPVSQRLPILLLRATAASGCSRRPLPPLDCARRRPAGSTTAQGAYAAASPEASGARVFCVCPRQEKVRRHALIMQLRTLRVVLDAKCCAAKVEARQGAAVVRIRGMQRISYLWKRFRSLR